MSSYNLSSPLIGFVPLGCVNGREYFQGCKGSTSSYGRVAPPSAEGAPINADHSHFVFVDAGLESGSARGSEDKLRSAFETFYTVNRGVPIIYIVLQGGALAITLTLTQTHTLTLILILTLILTIILTLTLTNPTPNPNSNSNSSLDPNPNPNPNPDPNPNQELML